MSDQSWNDVISRITPAAPVDIDDDLAPLANAGDAADPTPLHSTVAYQSIPVGFAAEDTVCFGVRVTEKTPNIVSLAMQVAQMAAEKGGYPVILSHVDYCGLERFGFRVERIVGGSQEERRICEEQVCAFWKITLVI